MLKEGRLNGVLSPRIELMGGASTEDFSPANLIMTKITSSNQYLHLRPASAEAALLSERLEL